jgi:hypothetical protein
VDPRGFLDTVRELNAAVATESPFNPNIKDGRCTRGLWANTIDTPPFLGFAVTCGITFTFGGLRINTAGEVLSTEGTPIRGLYAAGELVGGLFYFNYPGGTGQCPARFLAGSPETRPVPPRAKLTDFLRAPCLFLIKLLAYRFRRTDSLDHSRRRQSQRRGQHRRRGRSGRRGKRDRESAARARLARDAASRMRVTAVPGRGVYHRLCRGPGATANAGERQGARRMPRAGGERRRSVSLLCWPARDHGLRGNVLPRIVLEP